MPFHSPNPVASSVETGFYNHELSMPYFLPCLRPRSHMHPMIVRINDVGHAEAIDYRNFQYCPQEAENKYYLTRWAELYFSRNRFTIERDQTQSLYFLNSDVQRAVVDQERKDNSIQNYVKDSTLPYVDVEIKNVILDDLRQSPYSARIEFEKVYTNPADHSELKRERWTASVTYASDVSDRICHGTSR